jgi:hypothetical protein
VSRNQQSEMWYAMRSLRFELEADLVVGDVVEEKFMGCSNQKLTVLRYGVQ